MDIRIIDNKKERRETLANPNPSSDFWFDEVSPKVYSGKSVTEDTSLSYSPFYAAVRIRSNTMSTLPLILYRRVGDNKERALNHPLYNILKNSPNSIQTTQEWLELVSVHKDMLGNHFSFILRDNAGRVQALWPVHPSRVQIKIDAETREPFYLVQSGMNTTTNTTIWSMGETLHFRDLSTDGIVGISKIKAAKQAIGYGLGLEDFSSRFFDNDASSGLIITHPEGIGDIAEKNLKDKWERSSRGENRHRVRILQEGAKVEKITIAPEDAQFLESRQFSVQEIARFMGVPPHMLSDLSKSSFNNIEQQSLEFLFNSIRPELVKIEQRINKVLLGNSDEFFVEFLIDARERADIKSRYDAFSVGLNAGFLTANEVRGFENLPKIEGGDDLRVPMNMAPVGQARAGHLVDPKKKKKKKRDINTTTSEENEHTHTVSFPDSSEEPGTVNTREGGENPHTHTVAFPAFEEGESFSYETSEVNQHTHTGTVNSEDRGLTSFIDMIHDYRKGKVVTRALPRHVLLRDEFREEFHNVATEILDEEIPRLRKILEDADTAERLENQLTDFFESHRTFVNNQIEPLLLRYTNALSLANAAEADREVVDITEFVEKLIASAVLRWIRSSRRQLDKLFDKESRLKRLDEWEEKRASKFASIESTQIQGAAVRASFIALGFTKLVWRTRGDNCPFCNRLNNKTVDINSSFVQQNETIDGEGEGNFTSQKTLRHPPLHSGCDCYISSG